jgi:hypothetical protein
METLMTLPGVLAVIIGTLIASVLTGCGVQMGTSEYWNTYTDRVAEINRPGRVEIVESPPPNVEREKLYRAAQMFGVVQPMKRKQQEPMDSYTRAEKQQLGAVMRGAK